MEVFMRNISFNVTQDQLISELAQILHGPRYSRFSQSPLNFRVFLHRDKNRIHRNAGHGTLTLPSDEVGRQFLQEYGEGISIYACIVDRRQIKFSKSKNKARTEVLETVARQPYVDPKVAEKQKIERAMALSEDKVYLAAIQFGWDCRDSVFSIEWEHSLDGKGFLSLDTDERELRIKIPRPTDILVIAIRLSRITMVSAHTSILGQPIIYLTLEVPPSFELESIPPTTPRTRLSALPIGNHAEVAPYTSLAIRLICHSRRDLSKFRDIGRQAQFHRITAIECYVERRGLFSSAVQEQVERWLRRLNWCISFQLVSLIRSLSIDMMELLSLRPHIVDLVKGKGKQYVASMLRDFGPQARQLFWSDPEAEDQSLLDCFSRVQKEFDAHSNVSLEPTDGSLYNAYHVEITPTSMRLTGPHLERSNRVIRRYHSDNHESFLRVSFVEEGRLQYRFDRAIDGPAFIRDRVGQFLLNGLRIADREFRFLAYSQSALKEHAVWFVKPFRDPQRGYIDAPAIIESLGSFHHLEFDPDLTFCPARYGARISQAFTATDASVTIEDVEEIFPIEDIKTPSGDYCFTDGVGTISKDLALEISRELKSKRRRGRNNKGRPRAFQIRFQGSKGMLSVDYTLGGRAICLRPSMTKFEDPDSREIEIARAFDKPGPYFLNRPLIMLLEGLGVRYEVFKEFQDMAVHETEQSTQSLSQAASMFEIHGLGASFRIPSVMLSLQKLGLDNMSGPFYRQMMECAIHHILRLLKNRARIPIPGAWTLVGVADVHKFLQEGEIFACIKPTNGGAKYLEGPILISRSPTIHPGDVQIAHAIGPPPEGSCFAREPLPNTVVFSVLGSRPLPSCLGGGDLDGDVYNLIPLNTHPEFKIPTTYEPASYEPVQKKLVDHPCTMEDVAEFVMEYINSDVLGIVGINWLILADQSTEGIFDRDCLMLADLHSNAVDYPKSGNPVALQKIPKLHSNMKPDWNAPETVNPSSGRYYPSDRAIGRLFRDITLPDTTSKPGPVKSKGKKKGKGKGNEPNIGQLSGLLDELSVAGDAHDLLQEIVEFRVLQFLDIEAEASEEVVDQIQGIFNRYVSELGNACATHSLSYSRSAVLTEEEAIVGTIVQRTSQPRLRQDMMAKLRDRTDVLVRGVREELAGDSDDVLEDYLERSWLAWKASIAAEKSFGAESFGWVALGGIFDAIKEIEEAQLEESRSRFY
ncbi:hypothetical protein H0H81_003758 [Sphagnurus paluster]|uniref:RNA-dependent RNA polymerase n=1 Tax=Sphagnurus paluster TaxID=117069 RepID=A0A9P7KND6_9AGAR|nr:hypothetical protein H0H81_003758 [Sphagnurus paluster]